MVPGCAHTCALVGDLVAENARLRGLDESTARVGLGLVVTAAPTYTCRACSAVYTSHTAARECADFDDGYTD